MVCRQAAPDDVSERVDLGRNPQGNRTSGRRARQQHLLDWLEVELPNYFLGRVLAVDAHTADRWGRLLGNAGRPCLPWTASRGNCRKLHDLTLVTRNTADLPSWGCA